VVLGLCLLLPGTAFAQEPQPLPPDEEPGAPAPDAADVAADYERAFELMVAGHYADAAAIFESVSARTGDPARQASSRELARLARRMAEAHGQPTAAPGAATSVRFDDGRIELVVASTLAAFYSGFFLIDIFDVTDFRAETALVTGVSAAGFASSLLLTRGERIPGSMAESYTLGLWSGLANGLLLAPILGVDPDSPGPEDGEVNENYLTVGLVTMAAGGVAGAYLGHTIEPTRGQVRLAGTLGISGVATTGLMLVIIQPEDIDGDTVAALLAGGLDVGIGAGAALAPQVDWSTSRTSLVALSEFLGTLGGFTIAAIALGADGPESDNEARLAATCVLTGMWGGFALGTYFTRDYAPDARFEKKAAATQAARWQLAPMLARELRGVGIVGIF
jgi:hypothetical protein